MRSWARTRGRNCSPSRAHPRRLLSGRRRWRSCSLSRSSSGRRSSGPGFVSSSAPLPRQGGGRGRRGGRSGHLVPPLFLAALVVDNDSGLLALLVLLVTIHLALCSLLSTPGPRCSASWPVCTRRTVTQYLLVMMPLALFCCDSTGAVLGQFIGPLCATTGSLVQGPFLD